MREFETKDGEQRVDPVSVAYAALVESGGGGEESRPSRSAHHDGSRVDRLPTRGGVVDPLAVTRAALMAEESSMASPQAERPTDRPRRGLLSRLRAKRHQGEESSTPPVAPETAQHDDSLSDERSGNEDEGWVFHETGSDGDFEGWLYHYADGTMVDADGTVFEHVQGGAITQTQTQPEPEAEPEPEPEPVPAPAPAPAPKAEPEPEPEPDPVPEPVADSAPAEIPAFVQYTSSSLPTYVLGAVGLVAAVAGVLTLIAVLKDPSGSALLLPVLLGLVAAAAWWAFDRVNPATVTVRNGVLTVVRGDDTEEHDLRDPATDVRLGDDPRSRRWKAEVRTDDGPTSVIRASEVKARQFAQILEHHRGGPRPTEEPPAGREAS